VTSLLIPGAGLKFTNGIVVIYYKNPIDK